MVHRKKSKTPRFESLMLVDGVMAAIWPSILLSINRLLRQHRKWIPKVSIERLRNVLKGAPIVAVRDTKTGQLVAFAVLCEVQYLSLHQLLVRDYCVTQRLGRNRRTVLRLLEQRIEAYAQEKGVPQGFLTNSNGRERRSLRSFEWEEVPTTVLIKHYARWSS